MKDKYYDFSSSIVIGVILIIVGNTLLLGKTNIYKDIVAIFLFVMWIKVIKQLMTFFLKKEPRGVPHPPTDMRPTPWADRPAPRRRWRGCGYEDRAGRGSASCPARRRAWRPPEPRATGPPPRSARQSNGPAPAFPRWTPREYPARPRHSARGHRQGPAPPTGRDCSAAP